MERYVEVDYVGMGDFYALATTSVKKGTVLLKLSGQLCLFRTRHSIETLGGCHVEDPIGSFINHSFDPNCKITQEGELIALRDLKAGEEVTTNYLHHEKQISFPFFDHRTGKPVGNP